MTLSRGDAEGQWAPAVSPSLSRGVRTRTPGGFFRVHRAVPSARGAQCPALLRRLECERPGPIPRGRARSACRQEPHSGSFVGLGNPAAAKSSTRLRAACSRPSSACDHCIPLPASSRLWPHSTQTLRRRFDGVSERLGLPTARSHFRPEGNAHVATNRR